MKSKLAAFKCHHGPTNTFMLTSPIGMLQLVSCPKGIHLLQLPEVVTDDDFKPDPRTEVTISSQMYEDNGYTYKPALESVKWLQLYFTGLLEDHTLPPLCVTNNTNGTFTQKVWQNLASQVNYGHTVSYGELAKMSSNPQAAQAVGQAMRRNPVMIIIPCHRVLLGSGQIGNYSGGHKNKVKDWLLRHEGVLN